MQIIVIGAGASGLMAAGIASQNGNNVTIFEKMGQAGKKIRISGKGRCNITNAADISDFIDQIPGNGNFLYSALYSFTNTELIEFFEKLGVKTKVERGNRVFPVSDSAEDVLNALLNFLKKKNVKIKYNSQVKNIIIQDGIAKGIILQDESKHFADKIILATGGMSYPGTGSTGDGYELAKNVGHKIIAPKPSLVGLVCKEKWVTELQGLSLKNVKVELKNEKGKIIYSDFGEMLFTHFGVSGPVILSGSRAIHSYITEGLKIAGVTLEIDLKPALTLEKLDLRIQRDFEKYINKQFKNSLNELLPEKIIPVVTDISKIDGSKQVNSITKEERAKLAQILKKLKVSIVALRPIEEAIVTAGGIDTTEINPGTMESKLIKNLYFCGEVIDVDAYTGGFNLQIAFSTGHLAGENNQ